MSTTAQRVRKEVSKSPLEVTRVYTSNFQKEGTITAEIKQTVTTKSFYPSKSVSNNLQDNPFSTAEFGFAEQEFTADEKRVVWIDVPVGTTLEQVEAKIKANPEAVIYRIMANKPILSENQLYGITAGLTTKDAIADKQAVRYPVGHPEAGQLILRNGKPQYKDTFFKMSATADIDVRNEDPLDYYATPTIKMELSGVSDAVVAEQDVM